MTTTDAIRTALLLAQGHDQNTLRRLASIGMLHRVRHGGYVTDPGSDERARHRQLIEATIPLLGPTTVISHWSAAVLHGLPVWNAWLGRVAVTRPPNSHGVRDRWLHSHSCPLPEDEVDIDQFLWPVTDLSRTGLDLARSQPFSQGVAVLDAVRRAGVGADHLDDLIARSPRRPGMGRARQVVLFSNPGAESPGESLSRVFLRDHGFPPPVLQYRVEGPSGEFVGRCDFGWPDAGVLGEFDGRTKYQGEFVPDSTGLGVLLDEKARESRIRELGWILVRWTWPELGQPQALARRLWAGFRQAARVRAA